MKEYIEEANSICQKLRLATEFEICNVDDAHSPVSKASERVSVVAIKKKLGDRRYSVDNWNPAEFERQLKFLRDVAESFEAVAADAEYEYKSHDSVATIEESQHLPEQNKESELRSPDNLESDTPDASVSVTTHDAGDKMQATQESSYLRLLGLGRIFSDAVQSAICSQGRNFESSDDTPFPVAIYGFSGNTLGVLEIKIDKNVEVLRHAARRMSRSLSVRSPKSSSMDGHLTKPAPIQIKIKALRLKVSEGKTHGTWLTIRILSDNLDANLKTKHIRVHSSALPNMSNDDSLYSYELNGTIDLQSPSSIVIEVWGFTSPNKAILPRRPAQSVDMIPAQVGFYLSIDVFERESDGMYRPVPIKPDGSLRLTCGYPRRLNVRVTQSDVSTFVLSSIQRVAISSPIHVTGAELICDDGHLGLGGKVTKMVQHYDGICHHNVELHKLGVGKAASGGGDNTFTKDTEQLSSLQTLQFRADSTVDAASRSVNAVLKWDQQEEQPDPNGKRSLYHVVIALKTVESNTPVIVSKCLVVKLGTATISAAKRFKREVDISKTAWWTRDSFTRNFRTGTWYSADTPVELSNGEGITNSLEEDAVDNQLVDDSKLLADDTRDDTDLTTKINAHIKNSQAMGLGLELEHVRQMVWMMLRDGVTPPVKNGEHQESASGGSDLMVDHVNTQLHKLNCLNKFSSQVECVECPGSDARTLLFLRFKCKPSLMVDLVDGSLVAESCDISPASTENTTKIEAVTTVGAYHTGFYAIEPCDFSSCDEGHNRTLSGFLMLSISLSPDKAAAALVAPYPSKKQPVGRHSITMLNATKDSPKSWQRQWFVLRRPFLYAYDSIERKVLTGVMDISSCQVVAPPSSHQTSISAAKHLPSSLSSSVGNGSMSSGRSWVMAEVPEGTGPGLMPFSFRLIKMSGASDGNNKARCVMWTLQASTAPEMQAWLAGIEPFKVQSTGVETAHLAISTGRSGYEEN